MARPKKSDMERLTIYLSPELKTRFDNAVGGKYGEQSRIVQELIAQWLDQQEGERSVTIRLDPDLQAKLKFLIHRNDQSEEETLKKLIKREKWSHDKHNNQRSHVAEIRALTEALARHTGIDIEQILQKARKELEEGRRLSEQDESTGN